MHFLWIHGTSVCMNSAHGSRSKDLLFVHGEASTICQAYKFLGNGAACLSSSSKSQIRNYVRIETKMHFQIM